MTRRATRLRPLAIRRVALPHALKAAARGVLLAEAALDLALVPVELGEEPHISSSLISPEATAAREGAPVAAINVAARGALRARTQHLVDGPAQRAAEVRRPLVARLIVERLADESLSLSELDLAQLLRAEPGEEQGKRVVARAPGLVLIGVFVSANCGRGQHLQVHAFGHMFRASLGREAPTGLRDELWRARSPRARVNESIQRHLPRAAGSWRRHGGCRRRGPARGRARRGGS